MSKLGHCRCGHIAAVHKNLRGGLFGGWVCQDSDCMCEDYSSATLHPSVTDDLPSNVAQEANDDARHPPEPGDSCPTCGRRMPMTGKQRQAKHRAKERDG